jgi:UDP-N-acetylglucosamine--N-acetylmuramyl-(pentapeptide) pyrophosphoryl-undecaprenol N-acetylglucosamine transferase
MPGAIAGADLVIGRAGAGAVSETCAIGRPGLFVPYPFAGDHQKHNADSLAREGAAVWLPSAQATPARLAQELRSLMADPAKLTAMARNAARLGRPHAAKTIAQDLLKLAGVAFPLTTDDSRLSPASDNGFVQLTEVA